MLHNNVNGSENNQVNLGSRTSSSSEENRGEEWVLDKHDSSKNYCAGDIEKISMPDDQNKDYYELNQNNK